MPLLWHYGHIFCFSLEKNFFTFIKRRALKYETLVGSLDCCRNLSLPFQRLYICSILVARGSLSHRPKCLFQSVFSFLFSFLACSFSGSFTFTDHLLCCTLLCVVFSCSCQEDVSQTNWLQQMERRRERERAVDEKLFCRSFSAFIFFRSASTVRLQASKCVCLPACPTVI